MRPDLATIGIVPTIDRWKGWLNIRYKSSFHVLVIYQARDSVVSRYAGKLKTFPCMSQYFVYCVRNFKSSALLQEFSNIGTGPCR